MSVSVSLAFEVDGNTHRFSVVAENLDKAATQAALIAQNAPQTIREAK